MVQAAVQEAAPPPPPITTYGPDGSPDELPPDLLPSAPAEPAGGGGLPATVEELGLVTPYGRFLLPFHALEQGFLRD